ncbi:MAG: hypothetical protein IJI43_01250 [Bacilli bacterium]|nr:hypothetical protein [Bacilli bacterium]
MNKRVLLILSIFIIVSLSITIYIVNNKNKKEKLVDKAVDISSNLSKKNPNYKSIIKDLDNNVADKKYKLVETAYNNYMLNVTYKIEEIKRNIDTDKIYNLLDIKNIRDDGQEFKDTSKYISDTKNRLKSYKKDLKKLTSNKTIMSYLPVEATSSEKELYKELISYTKVDDKALLKSLDDVQNTIEKEEKVINFLKENKDHWEIDNNKVAFTDENLLNKYNTLLKNIK